MDNLFSLEKFSDLVTNYAPGVVGAILTLIIGFWVIGMIVSGIQKMKKKNGIDKTIQPFLG